HFGVYDYTAACGVTAAHQSLRHPACDFARHVMQVALAGTGVTLSDGATNVLPVPRHVAAAGAISSEAEREDNRRAIPAAWRAHRAGRARHRPHARGAAGPELRRHPGRAPATRRLRRTRRPGGPARRAPRIDGRAPERPGDILAPCK